MKKFKIELDFEGLVLFDPQTLVDFLKEQQIDTPKVFQYFIDHEEVGMSAIEKGIIVPIYPIKAEDYLIEAGMGEQKRNEENTVLFTNERYGLSITSSIVVFTDIYAIIDWDSADFFLNYKEHYATKSAHNDCFDLPNGLYRVRINGFRKAVGAGYEFLFLETDQLPQLDEHAEVDDFDFNVY